MTFFLGLLAVVSLLAGGAWVGATVLTLGDLGEGVGGAVIAGAAAFFFNLLLPAIFAMPLAMKKKKPALIWSATILVWNAAVAIALFTLQPELANRALAEHGRWWLPQSQELAHAPEAPVVEPPPVQKASITEAETEKAMNAKELFTARADTVVLIRVQQRKSPDDLLDLLVGKQEKTAEAKRDVWMNGLGSGFFVSRDGLFVTNHHVLGDAERAAVFTRDGRRFDGVEVLVSDPANDLVLARITEDGLAAAPVVPDGAEVGDTVFAVGSPLGLQFTLTQGIISAKRDMQNTRFVQTQTDIAAGSSGGPLFSDRGEVVGVNTAGAGAAGLNLAVDASHVRALLAAPRTSKPLSDYVRTAEVTSFELESGTLQPVDRMNLLSLLELIAAQADPCIDALPVDAFIEVNFSPGGGVKSNLDSKAEQCFIKSNKYEISRAFAEVRTGRKGAGGQPIRARAKIEGLSLEGGRGKPRGEGVLELRMIAGESEH